MPPSNDRLHTARTVKSDEFYTQIEDIEREMAHYRDHFRDKVVLLNCDDPEESHFWRYFESNFDHLGLQRLVSTHYSATRPTSRLELLRGVSGAVRTPLEGNGDFRSPEAVEQLMEADIVVTNPPFSLFREYVDQLVEHGKDFIVLGNLNAITYRSVWPLIQSNKLWWGPSISSGDRAFRVPDSYPLEASNCWVDDNGDKWVRVKGVRWFSTLEHQCRHQVLGLVREYDPSIYPSYDNYDAINISRVVDIPADYDGVMGVPITFLDKWNPDQFEIVGQLSGNTRASSDPETLRALGYRQHPQDKGGVGVIDGKRIYARIAIRRIQKEAHA